MWRTALKQWNEGKEYWAIPRRDTGAYRQVVNIIDDMKKPKPVVRVEAVKDPRYNGGWGSSRMTRAQVAKEAYDSNIKRTSKILNNFETYYTADLYKKLNKNEKLNMFNEIYNLYDIKYATSPVYLALKEKIDRFEIPAFAKRGYENWLKNGKDSVGKYNTGRAPNTAYDKLQARR